MTDVRTIDAVLSAAERAATAGDFSAAEPLLREAVELQEAAPGPGLVNGLNNLGVVYERLERYDEAERAYRRAYDVARRALAADHPFAATVEENLRQFCSARGLPFPTAPPSPAAGQPAAEPRPRPARSDAAHLDAFHAEPDAGAGAAPGRVEPPRPPARSSAASSPAAARSSAPSAPTPVDPGPSMSAPGTPSSPPRGVAAPSRPDVADAEFPRRSGWSLALAAAGVAGVAAVYVWLSLGAPATPSPEPAPAGLSAGVDPPPVLTPTPPVSEGSGPAETVAAPGTGASAVAPATAPPTAGSAEPGATAAPAEPSATAGGSIRVLRAAVCDDFATQGTPDWRCSPVAGDVAPRRLTFYTRVAADRATTVEHLWYRDDALRQRVSLAIRANGAGFRTYSRHLTAPGAWRVEVRGTGNELLHEERFVVR